MTTNLSLIDCSKIKRAIFLRSDNATLHPLVLGEKLEDCHIISEILNEDSDDERWFIFYVEDCYSPPMTLVRARSWEEAYEIYIDWAAEHRGLEITEDARKDYEGPDGLVCSYTSNGVPVDTKSIQGFEVRLERIEF